MRTDILLHTKGIEYPPSQQTLQAIYSSVPTLPPSGRDGQALHANASEQMDTKHYSIVNCFDQVCCCMSHKLELNDEEAIFRMSNCCMQMISREPYAQLGSVEPISGCMGLCKTVHTDKNHICPGCGCSHPLVNEIATELQHRKVKRGNIAQIRMQDDHEICAQWFINKSCNHRYDDDGDYIISLFSSFDAWDAPPTRNIPEPGIRGLSPSAQEKRWPEDRKTRAS